MKISCAQMKVKQAKFDENIENAICFVKKASKEKSDIVIFPEMFLSGFNYAANKKLLKAFPSYFEEAMCKTAKENNIAICGTFPAIDKSGDCYNRLYFIGNKGEILSCYDKMHLFGLFNEDKHIKRGESLKMLDFNSTKIGFGICYDLRFPEMFRDMAFAGCQLFILPAAWPHPRLAHWQHLLRARAIENQAFFVGVNQCSIEDFGSKKTHYFGSSSIIDPWGETLAEAILDKEDFVSALIDPKYSTYIRKEIPAFDDSFYYKKNMEKK